MVIAMLLLLFVVAVVVVELIWRQSLSKNLNPH